MKYRILWIAGLMMLLTACGSEMMEHASNGMMARHHATIPDEYAGVSNPITADEASLARGEEVYTANCASCHGDGGVGDGPVGEALDPGPTNIAHTSQMLGDDYLLWRISEGGAEEPFNSAMPSWKATLDEEARWDVINYIRALGSEEVMQDGALHARQAEVAAHGAQVMPFDLDQTHHVFDPLDDGGLQTVTANDPSNEEQIGLIQEHLAEIAQEFQEGNFSDPAQIHGHEMPGLEELRAGASRMEITYSALPDGGQIRYRSEEAELVNAIHHWFTAQVSDHGQHASDN